jgi:hypothetical protein
MRVPAAHLALQMVGHLLGSELLPLFRDHHLEGQVKQEIAHLAADGGGLALTERVVQLEGLLDQVGPQRFPGLRPVPGTPPAEVTDHRHRTSKR